MRLGNIAAACHREGGAWNSPGRHGTRVLIAAVVCPAARPSGHSAMRMRQVRGRPGVQGKERCWEDKKSRKKEMGKKKKKEEQKRKG